ncbi:MAG TPA: hypothetical protein VNR60_12505 [Croceibacterium sp.]|nr:hypothetical protein [Croceibacterium sp.]
MAGPQPPVIVGMTTLPSRIGMIRPAIDSLLHNTRKPDRIILTVPRRPLRGNGTVSIPDFLSGPGYRDSVTVNLIDEDCGPGSKLLGCLNYITSPSVIILADDDMDYRDCLIERLYTAQLAAPRKSFSFYAYRFRGMTVGQGADGFSFRSENLTGIDAFYRDHVKGRDLVFHDDLWISYFLLRQGVEIEALPVPTPYDLIYRTVHSQDALKDLEGELNRDRLAAEGLRHLRQSAPLPRSAEYRLTLQAFADRAVKKIRHIAGHG